MSIWKIIIEDLSGWKACAENVPTLLNDYQKRHRKQVYQDIIDCLKTEPSFLFRVLTDDETDSGVQPGNQVQNKVHKIPRCTLHSLREKQQEMWLDKSLQLHRDNATTYNGLSIQQSLAAKNTGVLEQISFLILLRVTFFFSKTQDYFGDPF